MQAPPIWLVANWKMNGTREDAARFAFHANQALMAAPASLTAVFCPPAIHLESAQRNLPQNARLKLGAQDCHAEPHGAYTGSISARMLRDAGCQFVILGHSERRQSCFEDCDAVAAKAHAAQEAGIAPILCVGETHEQYAAGETMAVLQRQCAAFAALPVAEMLIAYEPVWAIGSGKTPSADEIARAHATIKSELGSAVCVLYGGSVKPDNLREILAIDGVSGALIGGASLAIDSMRTMIAIAGGKGRN